MHMWVGGLGSSPTLAFSQAQSHDGHDIGFLEAHQRRLLTLYSTYRF